jgi:hypothetical protein
MNKLLIAELLTVTENIKLAISELNADRPAMASGCIGASASILESINKKLARQQGWPDEQYKVKRK